MKKLLMFAAAGLLAVPATNAQAEVGAAEVAPMIVAPVNDKAPVSGTPARLRRTDEEQPGNEMAKFAMFADNKKGLFVSMATELNGQPATHRMQLAVVPFSLVQTTTGKVTAQPDMAKARFATNIIGNEARIATRYVDLADMPAEQRARTAAAAGRCFDIPVLAFFCVAMPLDVYMRTFAEESRTGTLEMLITQPVPDWEVVLGKYLGALGLLAICIVATLTYPLAISRMGELDWGPVVGGYLGLFLGGASYVGFRVMVSAYTKDQITAFFVAFIVGALFFLLNKALIFFGSAASVLEYLCPDYHFNSIARGVIDARNIIYFVSVIAVSLLATARSLDSRRWS